VLHCELDENIVNDLSSGIDFIVIQSDYLKNMRPSIHILHYELNENIMGSTRVL
jgi:hypothetical protein